MINSNPETVSTDYDTSDKLYFEPLTREDVLNIIELEQPDGVIVQFGGQTPLNLAVPLDKAGVKIIGTQPDAIDRAEDRKRFQKFLQKLNLRQPDNDTVNTLDEALAVGQPDRLSGGGPPLLRPRRPRHADRLQRSGHPRFHGQPSACPASSTRSCIDKFLKDAIEVDVDAICDGRRTIIGGIMEHIEEAGIHSGDSACVLPPHTLSPAMIEEIKRGQPGPWPRNSGSSA